MKAIHRITEASQRVDLKAVTLFPSGCNPGVPINDKRMYPVYAKCVRARHPGASAASACPARGCR